MDVGARESLLVPGFMLVTAVLIIIFSITYYIQFWYFNPTIRGLKKFPGASVWIYLMKLYIQPSGYRDFRSLLSDWTRIYGPRFRLFVGHHFPLLFVSSPEDMQVGLAETVLVTHPDLLNRGHLLKQYEPWFGTNLLTAPAEKWKILKKSSSPFFAPRNLRALHPIVQSESIQLCSDLFKKNQEDVPFDIRPFLIRSFFKLAMLTTVGNVSDRQVETFIDGSKRYTYYFIIYFLLLGYPLPLAGIQARAFDEKNDDPVHQLLLKYFRFSKTVGMRVLRPWYISNYFWDMMPSGIQQALAVQMLETTFQEAISEGTLNSRKKMQNQDAGAGSTLLQILLNQRENGHTIFDSDDEILRTVMTVAGGASATTAVAVCWIFHFLGSHPTEQKILQEEIDDLLAELGESVSHYDLLGKMVKTEAFIYECMRLRPSIETMERQAGKDITFEDGAVVPAGSLIIGLIGTTAKDPNIFPDPEIFDMSRFYAEARRSRHPYSFIPFSGGARNCVGSLLAMVEMKTVLLNILSQFHIKAHCSLEEIGCNYYLGMHPKNAIKISLTKRE